MKTRCGSTCRGKRWNWRPSRGPSPARDRLLSEPLLSTSPPTGLQGRSHPLRESSLGGQCSQPVSQRRKLSSERCINALPTKQLTLGQSDSYAMCQVEGQSLGRQENLASCCRIRPDTRPASSLDLSFPIYLMRRWHSLSASSTIFLHWLTVSGSYDFSRYDRVSLHSRPTIPRAPPHMGWVGGCLWKRYFQTNDGGLAFPWGPELFLPPSLLPLTSTK